MNTLYFPNGANIKITNISNEQLFTTKEGIISPTLVPLKNVIDNQTPFTIQIPSFVSYKINSILPGDSITFIVKDIDEIMYYKKFAESDIKGIKIEVTPVEEVIIYGWHVDPSISDPDNAITYLEKAVDKTPAQMTNDGFSYGDWEDAFFMPKPCMVKYDGTVDYYLDPNDYTKKLDGTDSDVADPNYGGNAMMEWPKIWFKFEEGDTKGEGYFYCSNCQVDNTYDCWCNYDCDDNQIDHFYTAIYNGTSATSYDNTQTYKIGDWAIYNGSWYKAIVDQIAPVYYSSSSTYAVGDRCLYGSYSSPKLYECNTAIEIGESWTASHWTYLQSLDTWDISKWNLITSNYSLVSNQKLRSLSGMRTATINGNGKQDWSTVSMLANRNKDGTKHTWDIDLWSDRVLINALLVLMAKSLNTQGKYGCGKIHGPGTSDIKSDYVTGTHNNKGLFFGNISDNTVAVKVFGMENYWGLGWRWLAGLIGVANNTGYSVKMTYGTHDGTTTGYNATGNGYLTVGTRPNSGYCKESSFEWYGFLPLTTAYSSQGGSFTTYYCTYYYNNALDNVVAAVGGDGVYAEKPGATSLRLNFQQTAMDANIIASLSCKPVHSN